MKRLALLASVTALAALAQLPRETPSGMIFSDGATVTRSPRTAVAARPGELLLAGDRIKAGADGVSLLSCPERKIVKLAPNAEAVVTRRGFDTTPANLSTERLVAGCFLPPVKRAPVAGPLHLGATTMRGDTPQTPEGSLQTRIDALPESVRESLVIGLKSIQGGDAIAWVSRGALLEQAGLLSDASGNYQRALAQLPTAFWLQTKLVELAEAREKHAAIGK